MRSRRRTYTPEERATYNAAFDRWLSTVQCAKQCGRRAVFLSVAVTPTIVNGGGGRELSTSEEFVFCPECYGAGQQPGKQYLKLPLSTRALQDLRLKVSERRWLIGQLWLITRLVAGEPIHGFGGRPTDQPRGVVCVNCGAFDDRINPRWELTGRRCSQCGYPLTEQVCGEQELIPSI